MKKILMSIAVVVFSTSAMAGDVEAGKTKSATCGACHGADGNSAAAAFPKLAGQNEKYLIKQMNDIKSGARSVALMAGQLNSFSDEDIADVAAYFAAQAASIGNAKPELVELGQSLYRAGNTDTGVPACSACHSPTGKGNAAAGFPALSGQHADYIAAQLKAFRLGARDETASDSVRVNDGETRVMRDIAFKLKDFEIEALASYVNGLH